MYDELIKRLRNCATQAAPCKTCDMVEDGSCSDTLMKQAANAIEELKVAEKKYLANISALEAENQHLKRERAWIPVTERLPGIRKVVLITDGIDVGTGWMNQGWWNTSFADIQRDAVTHWMPLPQPPKEE